MKQLEQTHNVSKSVVVLVFNRRRGNKGSNPIVVMIHAKELPDIFELEILGSVP